MRLRDRFRVCFHEAPAIVGAVCCAALACASISCDRNRGAPDWNTPGGTVALVGETSGPAAAAPPEPAPEPADSEAAAAPGGSKGLRFISYNVENWLAMDRVVNRKTLKNSPKPDSEKQAVVAILARNAPDILGLCEIGEARDLAEIQSSLKAAGLDLPHSHYTGGADPVRHLGLLSRFPITSTAKPAETEFRLNGQTFGINRGILDATIQTRGKSYRFLGVHLKSKREIEEADQEQMRVHEARLLRRHVDSILLADPQARLIVYGDFNDTYPSTTVRTITGGADKDLRLKPIYLRDSRKHAWTHHWNHQDIYSRIDFITLAPGMDREVNFRASRIIDDPDWDKASDHRPLLAVFK
jgi:endonuclease/exonuclease/phosphatase family metal-dependent hydrolase